MSGVSSATLDKTDILDYGHTGQAKLRALSDKEFAALTESALANPKTKFLDANTKLFRELVSKVNKVNKIKVKTIENICQPKDKAKLEFFALDGIPGMQVPVDDEDWPDKGMMEKHITGIAKGTLLEFLQRLPCSDVPTYFDSIEEGILLGEMAMDDVLPLASERFPDLVSDNAMGLIAFWGIGAIFLEASPQNNPQAALQPGKSTGFDVDLSFLAGLECRPNFEGYGAKAHFSPDQKIESIFWCHGQKEYVPGDEGWEHAKWAWKATLGAATTAVTHLVQLHWIVVNATHVACRQELAAQHPVRMALKVFLYNTGGVNYGSTMSLYPENSFLHRMSALSYDGLTQAILFGDSTFLYETHPEFIARKKLGPEMEDLLPVAKDGLKVWWAYHRFFKDYMSLYYADDNAVTSDPDLIAYWDSIENRGGHGSPFKYGLPPLSLAALIDQMCHHAFYSTCWHEFVGALVHYLTTPEGLATKIVEGKEVMDSQTFIQGLCLIALTGTRQPQVMSNWKHLLPEKAHKLHDQLMADFEKIATDIEELNKNANDSNPARRRQCNSFNPRTFECSVSV